MWFEGAWKQAEQGLLGSILGSKHHCKDKINFDKLPALSMSFIYLFLFP